jgi:hypothetical protein
MVELREYKFFLYTNKIKFISISSHLISGFERFGILQLLPSTLKS